MKGRRVDVEPHLFEPGDYGIWDGVWYALPPGEPDMLANLGKHTVTLHEDDTITVSPSILISKPLGIFFGCRTESIQEWHGYLERGVWRVV